VLPPNHSNFMSEERGYKLAITGKGGVGKTTLASLLSYLYSSAGRRVIAVDADPDANLGSALGVSPEEMRARIARARAEMGPVVQSLHGKTIEVVVPMIFMLREHMNHHFQTIQIILLPMQVDLRQLIGLFMILMTLKVIIASG